jgi:hypothetical protein
MNRHLVRCFQENVGRRGVTFYDSEHCNFLDWQQVIQFLNALPPRNQKDDFAEKLAETLANYNPDKEFLAVQQSGDSVSVELYSLPKSHEERRFIR